MSSRLLLDDPPLVVQPQLAVAIGLNEAIVLQQIHYWLEQNRKARRHNINGTVWTYNSVPEWVSQFPFWSERTIWQTLKNLRASGLLIAEMHAKDKRDRTLWYTIDYEKLESITMQAAEVASPISRDLQDASSQKLRDVYKESETSPETFAETSAESKAADAAPPPKIVEAEIIPTLETLPTTLAKHAEGEFFGVCFDIYRQEKAPVWADHDALPDTTKTHLRKVAQRQKGWRQGAEIFRDALRRMRADTKFFGVTSLTLVNLGTHEKFVTEGEAYRSSRAGPANDSFSRRAGAIWGMLND